MKYEIKTMDLDRGAKLLIIKGAESELVFLGAGLRAGFVTVPIKKNHLPHLVEHLLFEGTKKYPTNSDLIFAAEKSGSTLNAGTNYKLIRLKHQTEKKYVFPTLDIMIEQLYNPLLKESSYENEKQVIYREICKHLDRPSRDVGINLSKLINTDSLSSKEELETLKEISYQDVLDFYAENFTATNTFFVVAGAFDETEVEKIRDYLNKGLKNVSVGKLKNIEFRKLKDYSRKAVSQNKNDIDNAYFDLTFVIPGEVIELQNKIRVLYALFNSGQGSLLFKVLRTEGLSYGASAGYSTTLPYSEFYITDSAQEERLPELFEKCLTVIKDIKEGKFSELDLERARAYSYGYLKRSYQTPIDLVDWYGSDFVLGKELTDYNEYVESLLVVTREDVIEVANLFFNKDNWALSLLGKDVEGKEKEFEKILDKYIS